MSIRALRAYCKEHYNESLEERAFTLCVTFKTIETRLYRYKWTFDEVLNTLRGEIPPRVIEEREQMQECLKKRYATLCAKDNVIKPHKPKKPTHM